MHSYDVEAGRDQFGLSDLAEDSDEDSGASGNKRTSFDREHGINGHNGSIQVPRRSKTLEFENVHIKGKGSKDERR